MAKRIPVQSTLPLYQQFTTLDGQDFLLTFAYNARDFSWYLDIADQDAVAIVSGIRIVVAWDLLRRCVDARRPPGVLIANDLSGAGLDPGADDFGTRVELLYFDAAEVADELANGG
jgi:hypothetical protein